MGYRCEWMPDWSDKPVVIIASGPSAKDVNFHLLHNRARAIAINNSWQLYPSAEALFSCDYVWWKAHQGVPEFAGMKITSDNRCFDGGDGEPRWPDLKYLKRIQGSDRLITERFGVVGWGGNSGFQAINLAVHMKAKKIILIGFDMTLEKGLHWHGRHEGRLHNPTTGNVDRWRRVTDAAYAKLCDLGITAYNCSPVSALVAYPKVSLEVALDTHHFHCLRSQVGWRIQSTTRLDIAKKCPAVSAR